MIEWIKEKLHNWSKKRKIAKARWKVIDDIKKDAYFDALEEEAERVGRAKARLDANNRIRKMKEMNVKKATFTERKIDIFGTQDIPQHKGERLNVISGQWERQ